MGKSFDDDVPVYTRESVITTGDDEKKQSVIDEWTDELACKMASDTDYTILDDGTVLWHKRDRRGGSNRQTIEMLNREVEKHRDGAEPNDDLTMMCLKIIKQN